MIMEYTSGVPAKTSLRTTTSRTNYNGIYLQGSSDNIIKNNKISNNWDGIELSYSNKNIIYLNNFINNTNQVYSYYSTNI